MNGERIEQFLETVTGYVEGLRDARAISESLWRHEDNMVVWIIGLAAGAVITVPPLLSQLINVQHLPRWALGLSLAPFVLAIPTGIVYRLVLAGHMKKNALFGFKKIHALEALRFRRFEAGQGLKQLGEKALAIVNDEPESIQGLKQAVEKSRPHVSRLKCGLYSLFLLGVLGVAIVGVYAW